MKKKKIRTIVDESVSNEMFARFQGYMANKGYKNLDSLFIAKEHRGMPDSQILHHLLNNETIFLTTDRPFHNTVISQGLRSYYINKNSLTSQRLKGIKNKEIILHKNDLNLKENYLPRKTDIRPLLLPSSEKVLKKLCTKRRRIRNHFDGLEHLEQVAITVSWQSSKSLTLFGIKIRISSNVGIKALDASESYIHDKIPSEDRTIGALNYALILSIQLMLNSVKTQVYYDYPKIDDPLLYLQDGHKTPYSMLFKELKNSFTNLEFIPSTKGLFIERLRTKLDNLYKGNSNEIVAGNIADILVKFGNINSVNSD